VAIYAVYPCRDFMPEKVNVFIEYLAARYGPEPYWNDGLDVGLLQGRTPRAAVRKPGPSADAIAAATRQTVGR
jgi:hypothetical protein